MDQLPFQVLFLIVCIIAGVYINRNNFSGAAQKVLGYYLPRPVIITCLSIFIGLVFWITINILLLRFK
ncbi:hypothetical protein A3C25_05345 [Candidatus Roizmanbacteria bacterium RIFCSPHIGHO2_02_FULL_38_11]|uniref:Uncharacterized protein n=1 Tax=Candidatus Roizmanbacteria bacterium RIFCSPHIGHO2_02_FULL_38_11 TaxID=1802039 RepID=A0A1F7GZZ5_9BACT|nr:MAG: hypothetical protein A3C25_05345 [Candidatus Roizmanbacteria bacterium RIFCSPHIGHO2_02_FULL_38_11]